MEVPMIDRSNIGMLLIDVQPAFLDSAFPEQTDGREALLVRLGHLLMLADWMDLPLIATFEKPVSENGELPVRLESVFPAKGQRFVKNYFGCTSEDEIRSAIEGQSIQQIAVAGTETDVCILQSVLGLLQMGYQVFLLEDCLFTGTFDQQPVDSVMKVIQIAFNLEMDQDKNSFIFSGSGCN